MLKQRNDGWKGGAAARGSWTPVQYTQNSECSATGAVTMAGQLLVTQRMAAARHKSQNLLLSSWRPTSPQASSQWESGPLLQPPPATKPAESASSGSLPFAGRCLRITPTHDSNPSRVAFFSQVSKPSTLGHASGGLFQSPTRGAGGVFASGFGRLRYAVRPTHPVVPPFSRLTCKIWPQHALYPCSGAAGVWVSKASNSCGGCRLM
jgi:hypothetical protein